MDYPTRMKGRIYSMLSARMGRMEKKECEISEHSKKSDGGNRICAI